MPSKKLSESDLYPAIAKWALKYFQCFQSDINVGLRYSRADVFCVRDAGGDLTNDHETIVVEVKKDKAPFATKSGQAYGYRVYANRVYLADYRDQAFSSAERLIAAQLGIGLIQVNSKLKCIEVQASPRYEPIPAMSFELLEKVNLGTCRICGVLFQTGETGNRYKLLAREDLRKAIKLEKGLVYWNYKLGERKKKAKFQKYDSAAYESFERRFICSECIAMLWAPLDSNAATSVATTK